MQRSDKLDKDVRCKVIHNPNHIVHRSETSSPENPRRLIRIMNFLEGRLKLFDKPEFELITEFPEATDDDILLVHDKEYINFVKNYCIRGGGFLGDSTYFAPHSYKAARTSAGGVISANVLVADGDVETTLALTRPPGHHASTDKFGGYCVFNNVAIAARYLQANGKADKVMIVDWDAHAGDGTMRIFYEDPTVLTLSIHRDPHDFYPHDGMGHQIGRGDGRGYNINVEMPEGSGDEEYLMVFDEIISPIYKSYKPDHLVGLVGFDAHYSDLQTNLQVTANGHYEIVRKLKKLNMGKLPLILEGGYTSENANLAHTILNALIDEPEPYKDDIDSLSSSVTRFQKTRTMLEAKIAELIPLLSDYHDI